MESELLQKARVLKEKGARYITTIAHLNVEDETKIILKLFFDLEGKIEELSVEKKLGDPIESLKDLYPAAIWAEREIMETYGIEFIGYSEEEKSLMLPPSQKTFPFLELEKNKILRRKQWK